MRNKKFGDEEFPTNSRAMDDGKYLDHSRLRKKPEEIPDKDPRGKNEAVKIPSGLIEGVKFSQGSIKHRSVYEPDTREFVDKKSPAGVKPGGGK